MNELTKVTGQGGVSVSRAANSTLLIRLSGPWPLTRDVPSAAILHTELESPDALKTVSFDTSGLTHWDSGFDRFSGPDQRGLPRSPHRTGPTRSACWLAAIAGTGGGSPREERHAK